MLNDFNRCRFIYRKRRRLSEDKEDEEDKLCSFTVKYNPGKFRSPEEYTEGGNLTEKVDIYQMGNVFYSLLTLLLPFEGVVEGETTTTLDKNNDSDHDEVAVIQKMIRDGERPDITLINDDHGTTDGNGEGEGQVSRVFKEAIEMCWRQNPLDRPTASEVVEFLEKELDRIIEMGLYS